VPYKDNEDTIPLPEVIIPSLSNGTPQVKTLFTRLDLYIPIDSWLFQLNKNNLPENQSLSLIDLNKIELNNKILL